MVAEFSKETVNVSYTSEGTPPMFDCSDVCLSYLNSTHGLHGFFIDIGAQHPVFGKKILIKIFQYAHYYLITIAISENSFRFGNVVIRSVGQIEIALQCPTGLLDIMMLMNVIPVDVPAKLGLDVLDAESLYDVTNRLVYRKLNSH